MLAAPPPPPRCTTSELRVTLGRSGVGLGNVETPILVRNVGGRICFVAGYASIALPVPWRVIEGSSYFEHDPKPHRVVLRPGDRAETQIAYNDVVKRCVRPAWISVLGRRVPFADTICGVIAIPALRRLVPPRRTTP